MPVFALPLAFLGMIALPGVAAIYLLRSRSRRRVVSSLMLWADQQKPRAGGLKLQRIQTPLLLLLELLAIVLLVLAAAGPRVPTNRNTRPLVIVLDDSYSMRAGGDQSPRRLAEQAIRRELDTGRHMPCRFVLAGQEPRLLAEPARTAAAAVKSLDGWKCQSPSADIDAAISLAAALGGEADRARIMVITDHKGPDNIEPGRLEWLSLGRSRANVAFTNAVRASDGATDRCLIEVANLSDTARSIKLTLGDRPARTLKIPPGARRQVRLVLKAGSGPLTARISDDDLDADNSLVLLPEPPQPVRVDVRVADGALRKSIVDALRASGRATETSLGAHLLITDQSGASAPASQAWLVQLTVEKESAAYVGPFVIDRAHPLTSGLALDGTIWAAGKEHKFPGAVVIAAGNVPLLTEVRRPGGRRDIRLRIRQDISTVQDSANWPILIWNLLEYRATELPGLRRHNVRLGSRVRLNLPASASLTVTAPDGQRRDMTVGDATAVISADSSGVYKLDSGLRTWSLASNALHPDESDLRNHQSGRWGSWLDDRAMRNEYASASWALILCAMVLLCGHMALIARSGGGLGR